MSVPLLHILSLLDRLAEFCWFSFSTSTSSSAYVADINNAHFAQNKPSHNSSHFQPQNHSLLAKDSVNITENIAAMQFPPIVASSRTFLRSHLSNDREVEERVEMNNNNVTTVERATPSVPLTPDSNLDGYEFAIDYNSVNKSEGSNRQVHRAEEEKNVENKMRQPFVLVNNTKPSKSNTKASKIAKNAKLLETANDTTKRKIHPTEDKNDPKKMRLPFTLGLPITPPRKGKKTHKRADATKTSKITQTSKRKTHPTEDNNDQKKLRLPNTVSERATPPGKRQIPFRPRVRPLTPESSSNSDDGRRTPPQSPLSNIIQWTPINPPGGSYQTLQGDMKPAARAACEYDETEAEEEEESDEKATISVMKRRVIAKLRAKKANKMEEEESDAEASMPVMKRRVIATPRSKKSTKIEEDPVMRLLGVTEEMLEANIPTPPTSRSVRETSYMWRMVHMHKLEYYDCYYEA